MHKVLHIGPNTCSVVSHLLKEEETEAWGVEPYDIEDADGNCKALVRRGIVRVADIKFPLPYRPKSFSLVIVSDAVDYLSPRYLNKTIPDLARVSADGLVIFTGKRNLLYIKYARNFHAHLLISVFVCWVLFLKFSWNRPIFFTRLDQLMIFFHLWTICKSHTNHLQKKFKSFPLRVLEIYQFLMLEKDTHTKKWYWINE